MQLFCFTFAGGTAAFYDLLDPYLGDEVDIIKLEYAGHGTRHREGFYADFSELASDMYHQIKERLPLNSPYALMGYSMGSISLVEVLKLIIEKEEIPMPACVFLAAHEPKAKIELAGFSAEKADSFVKERTIQFGGVPDKLIENRIFWRMYLPIYRNDYGIIGKYRFEELNLNTTIPATFFYSETDTPFKDMKNWSRYFTGDTEYVCYEGNHFFIQQHCEEMCRIIRKKLLEPQEGGIK